MSLQTSQLNRRGFLTLGGVAAGTALTIADVPDAVAKGGATGTPFALGVASGDPLPDGVVLWTRLAPQPLAPDGRGGMPAKAVPVNWQVATDPGFANVVKAGAQHARPDWAHSVHVEVRGLRPAREYWYRFRVGNDVSPIGRTKTAPALGAALSSMTFAFASCQSYTAGHYTVLRHMAEDDLDLVVFLGDYIYEGGGRGSIGRAHLPHSEIFSLTDYRIRHSQYKTDPDLQAAHAAAPWVVVPDDHDVENNWAGDISQRDNEPDQDPAVFRQRRAAAYKAYYENMPLRRSSMPQGAEMQLYRRLTYGNLLQLNVLDTRRYRADQLPRGTLQERWDPSRTMLGAEQEAWLLDGLDASAATWNILGNQVFAMEADHAAGDAERYAMDTWSGYAAARQRLFDGVLERNVDNFVMVTGDAHRSAAADLKQEFFNADSATVGTEFLGTSVSSAGDGQAMDRLGRIWLDENPHMKFHNRQRGYQRVHLTHSELRTDYLVVPYVTRKEAPLTTAARVHVEAGRAGIAQVDA